MPSLAQRTRDLVSEADPEVSFGSWTTAVRRSVLSFEFDCERPQEFGGALNDRSLGEVNFVNMACGRHAAYRDGRAAAEAGYYVLTLQLSGSLRMEQDERAARLRPGEFAVYDSSRPARLVSSDDYRSTCVRFPKELLGGPHPEPLAEVTATAFAYEPGLPSVVWDTLISLNRNLHAMGPHAGLAVHNVMDMVGVMLRTAAGAVVRSDQEMLLHRIRAHIDAHLDDPELGPAQIAAAHYISLRQLHSLFERTGSSVARWIRTRRIELCKRDLADPANSSVPISTLAARRGFTNPSHFAQLFKRTTGRSPKAYRHAASRP
ncbi:helix-turn-helix domain-containing protein [Saccharopolyspora halophila]|uniref:Helix-turn-helix domain-containing protein n=1 Tax=Saccharopolyspora halophila TaxID=405551 RepID=A0ABN3GGH8_9PSEU